MLHARQMSNAMWGMQLSWLPQSLDIVQLLQKTPTCSCAFHCNLQSASWHNVCSTAPPFLFLRSGLVLELLLTKLRFAAERDPSMQLQIVAMSATMGGLEQMCTWLNAVGALGPACKSL